MSEIKNKGYILKASREKQLVAYKGTPITCSVNFSAGTFQTRKYWHNLVKGMKGEGAGKPATRNTLPRKVFIQI